MKQQKLTEPSLWEIKTYLSRIEDQLEAIRFEQPNFRLPKLLHPRDFFQLCCGILALAIAYKVIVW